jgi:type VI secretion system protein ImpM
MLLKQQDDLLLNNLKNHALQDVMACFGKLPCHPEFIHYPLQSNQNLSWQVWLQEGFAYLNLHYGAALSQVFPRMSAWQFILIDDSQYEFVLGTLVAGCDSRAQCFPFSVFRKFESTLAREYSSMMPLVYKEILDAEKLLCLKGWELESQGQFLKCLTALKQHSLLVQTEKIHAFESNVFDILNLGVMKKGLAEQHGIENFSAFLVQIDQELKIFSKKVSQEKYCGIRIPLPANKLNHTFVVFWLTLIEKILGKREKKLWVFWNQAYLMVYYPKMQPSYFQHFIEPSLAHEGLVNVSSTLRKNILASEMDASDLSESLSLFEVLTRWE